MKNILEKDGIIIVDGVEYVKKEIETKEMFWGVDVKEIEEFIHDLRYSTDCQEDLTYVFSHRCTRAVAQLLQLSLENLRKEQKENLK
jgi:hypothetical protein